MSSPFRLLSRPAKKNETDLDLFDETFLRQLELLLIASRKLLRGKHRGERKSRQLGSGLEFADRREYVAGDDIRDVDWSAFARLDQPYVRLFERDQDLPVRIAVDASASMLTKGGRKFRYARQIAAALAYIALSAQDRVGLAALREENVQQMPPTRGKGQVFRVFDFLRTCERGGPTNLRKTCTRWAASARQAGIAFVISDFYDLDGAFEAINQLRYRKHEVTCIQVLDPEESNPSPQQMRGEATLVDTENGHAVRTTLTPDLLARFAKEHERFCLEFEAKCRSHQIRYIRAQCDRSFDELILDVLRQEGAIR